MNFNEAFKLLRKGKILIVEDSEYRLASTYPPSIESRPKGSEDYPWVENFKGYFLFILASDEWEEVDVS